MKKTIKRRKDKKSIKKRRKSIKKIKGGDEIKVVSYKSLLDDIILYKVISKRDFPKEPLDVIVYEPLREVEESLAEIKKGIELNKDSFKKYPIARNATYINIEHPDKKIVPTISVRPST